jgi:hypothetical protein
MTRDGCYGYLKQLTLGQQLVLFREFNIEPPHFNDLEKAIAKWAKANKPKSNHPYPSWKPWESKTCRKNPSKN